MGDEGVRSLVEYLKRTASLVKVEFMDCKVSPLSCAGSFVYTAEEAKVMLSDIVYFSKMKNRPGSVVVLADGGAERAGCTGR